MFSSDDDDDARRVTQPEVVAAQSGRPQQDLLQAGHVRDVQGPVPEEAQGGDPFLCYQITPKFVDGIVKMNNSWVLSIYSLSQTIAAEKRQTSFESILSADLNTFS